MSMDSKPLKKIPRTKQVGIALILVSLLGLLVYVWFGVFSASENVPPEVPATKDQEVYEVLKRARQEVLIAPNSAEKWGELGKLFLAHLFSEKADDCFKVASELEPENPLWPYSRGIIASKKDPEQAIRLLRQAYQCKGDWDANRVAMAMQLAELLLENGNVEEAKELFLTEHQLNPQNPRAAFGLGLIQKSRGDNVNALELFEIARQSRYAKKKATANLASLSRTMNQTEQAEKLEQQLASLPTDPPWPDPLLDELVWYVVGRRGRERRAAIYEEQNEFGKAIDEYMTQIEKSAKASDYIGAGVNLARLKQYDKAVDCLQKAVAMEDDNSQGHYTMALVLFSQAERLIKANSSVDGKSKNLLRKAKIHAEKATKLRADFGLAYLFLGLSQKYLDNSSAAIKALEKGVELLPANPEMRVALVELYSKSGNAKRAEEHLTVATQLSPNDPRLPALREKITELKSKEKGS